MNTLSSTVYLYIYKKKKPPKLLFKRGQKALFLKMSILSSIGLVSYRYSLDSLSLLFIMMMIIFFIYKLKMGRKDIWNKLHNLKNNYLFCLVLTKEIFRFDIYYHYVELSNTLYIIKMVRKTNFYYIELLYQKWS